MEKAKTNDNKRYTLTFSEQWEIFTRIFQFAKPFIAYFIVAILLSLVTGGIDIVLPRIIQVFIDEKLAQGDMSWPTLWTYGGGYLLISIVKALIVYLNMYLFYLGVDHTIKNIRDQLYEKVHSLGMRFFDQTSTGWIVTRITNDTQGLYDFFDVFLVLIGSIINLIAAIIGMALLDVEVTLWMLLFIPIVALFAYLYQYYSTDIYAKMKTANSQLNTKLSESINGMSVIQQFRQEERLQKEFLETNEEYYQTRRRMTVLNATLLSPIIDFLYLVSIMVILGIFGFDSFNQWVDVGVVFAFTTYAKNMFNPMTELMNNLTFFQDGLISSERILRVFDNVEENPDQADEEDLEIKAGRVEFKNVTFSYDGVHPVLKDISFTVEPGQTLALVGQTGSGKSSIINVLMRFYEFQEGEVLIDGRSIRDYPIEELRENLGLVIQDPFLFYGTIADNIRLMDESLTDEEVKAAAEFVQADQFIDKLPDKYQEQVTERGSSYSSGERQLISFASIIAREPKILILDEATANIDTETEQLIQEALHKMQEGRTTIAIAHRLSTIQDADEIIVLRQGEIIERGDHQSLLAQDGTYKKMFEMQNIEDSQA